jgi:hypothetical protein
MTTDPSWLYSTIAQSSAAIVAIIGGFITATVLNLLSEKRSMQKQKSEKEADIEAAKEKRAKLYNIYETNKAERFLRKELARYSDEDIPTTLDEILANYPSDYGKFFDEKILKREFHRLSLRQVKAKLFVLKHADKIDIDNYNSFLDWLKAQVSTEEYLEISDEYDKYIERRKKSASASNAAVVSPSWAPTLSSGWITPWSGGIIQDQFERELEEEKRQSEQQANIYSGIEKLDYQISLLNYELENLNSQLSAFQYPSGLRWGVLTLAFLAAFCVLMPVIIIAFNAFYQWTQILTISTLCIGIIGVFSYIVFQIKELRRK